MAGGKSGSSKTSSSSSALFNHFNKVDQGPGKFEAECRYCGHKYKIMNNLGYGNLKNHLAKKHQEKVDEASGSSGN